MPPSGHTTSVPIESFSVKLVCVSCVAHWSRVAPLPRSWGFLLKDGDVPSVNHLEIKEINNNE